MAALVSADNLNTTAKVLRTPGVDNLNLSEGAAGLPGAPTSFTATALDEGAAVSWLPGTAGDLPTTGYRITATRSDGSLRVYTLGVVTSAELAGLPNCPEPAYFLVGVS